MTAPNLPLWLAPTSAGQLSNNHGSNTGADGIGFSARMSSPKGAASPLSLARFQAFRTGVGGNPSTSQLGWDSGWVGGNPAVSPLAAARQACGGNSSVVYNAGSGARLYLMASDGSLQSSPVSSAAVGTWRYENPLPAGSSGTLPIAYSMTQVAGRLYCTATITGYLQTLATLYMAAINADGTVGSWNQVAGTIVTFIDATWKNAGLLGGWDGISATGWIFVYKSGNTPVTFAVNVTDGSITTASTAAGGSPTVARDNLAGCFIGSTVAGTFKVYLIGGVAATASSVVDVAAISATTGISTGTWAAKQALPAARTGGTLITLQNGTVYYMGGVSTGGNASTATTTVYVSSAANIFNSVAWTTSANVLPAATYLAGGGITMPDYDFLGGTVATGDSATETFTGNALSSGKDAMVIASFKPSGTPALVGVKGAFTTAAGGTTISPTFGQATVAAHLLVAWVSGSDETGTGATNLGDTGAPTTYDYSGVNTDNDVSTADTITVPAGGIYINSISCHVGGHTAAVNMYLAVWNASTGAVITNSSLFSCPQGRALRTQNVTSTFVAAGVTLKIGWHRDPAKDAEWGVTASGSFDANYRAVLGSAPTTACASPYVCGKPQAYITYSTLTQSDITTASAGWLRASSQQNTTEQVQIWYKLNCGTAETAPTFTSAQGASVLYAQLAEFSGIATTSAADQAGGLAQASSGTSMTVAASSVDGQGGDLVLTASRWVTGVANTASFSTTIANVTTPVNVGNSGASSTTRHASFNYGLLPAGAPTPSRSPNVVVCGGQDTGGANRTTVYSAQVNAGSIPNDIRPWLPQGLGTGASAGTLATDGSARLSPDPDGTQDVVVAYGSTGTQAGIAVGITSLANFNDGDQVTVTCQFVDLDGDPSPLASTVVTIGQAPTVSITSPSGAGSGNVNVTFGYNPGLGGGSQATWRAQITGATSGIVYADSLTRTDQTNDFMAPASGTPASLVAPLLDASESYVATVTVTSTDTPMDSNSTNSSPPTTTSFSVSGTAPVVPTNFSVTTSTTLAAAILTWTNPGGSIAAFNRIYYRRVGTLFWSLLVDNIPASTGASQSFTQMDQLAMGATYDLAVSAVDVTGGFESALSSPLVLNPDFETVAPSTATLWHSLGTEAGTDNSIAYWTQLGGASYSGHVVTITQATTGLAGGHQDWWDLGPVNVRFTFTTASRPGLCLHRKDASNWVEGWVDGGSLHLSKKIGGTVTLDVVPSVACALTTATSYWFVASVVGSVFTWKVYNDSAGVLGGTLIATLSSAVSDPSVQFGQIGLKNGGDGESSGASCSFGHASTTNTCTVTGPVPAVWTTAVTTGEPAFCLSKNAPLAGTYSLSIGIANSAGEGSWLQAGSAAPANTDTYSLNGALKGTGSPTIFRWQYDGGVVAPATVATTDGVWRTYSASGSVTAASALRGDAKGAGTYYFDNVSVAQAASAAITIPTPAGGYTAMLHVPGSTSVYAPLMLKDIYAPNKAGPITKEKIESIPAIVFGSATPLVRIGGYDYRSLDLNLIEYVAGDFAALQSVLNVMRRGTPVYFRSAAGHLMLVALQPDQEIAFLPQAYTALRFCKLALVQAANTYSVSLALGAGQGLLTQVNGSVPTLDPSELGL